MKPIGIVRRVDPVGRIVFPREMLRTLNINIGDFLEFLVEDNAIALRKHSPINKPYKQAIKNKE